MKTMMNRMTWPGLIAWALAGLVSAPARAADHLDGTAVLADPSTDITDVYSWMSSDAKDINLVMNVSPNAAASATFSNAAQYVFHVSSCAAYTGPAACTGSAMDIICTFTNSTPQKVSCWVGADEYVTGDASGTSGISSSDGKLKVFTGPRDDPFFFNLDGFKKAVATVTGAKAGLVPTANAAGCPTVDGATSAVLVGQLTSNPADGGAAIDHFAKFNVLSIVLQVDKTVLTKGGPIVSISGSTNK